MFLTMARIEFLVVIAFAALVCASEVDDNDQKKRGAGKTSLNTIPTGAQKQDYTYSIYSQNPSSQNIPSNPYQQQQQQQHTQISSSFYPSQVNSQYYTTPNVQSDQSSYVNQPQISLLPPQTSSQFVPINFVPNPGYQSKYQLVPSKPNSNIQLSFVQQPSTYPSQPFVQYPHSLYAPQPTSPISPQQNAFYGSLGPQGHTIPFQFGHSYLGQPSTMFLLAQPNPSLYNNLLYSNPAQSVYNYVPQNSQTRYSQGVSYSAPASSDGQVSLSQSVPKEENDISTHPGEYTSAPSDSSSSYKNAYASSQSSYSKL